MQKEILKIVNAIEPFDAQEAEHLAYARVWIESAEGLFRTHKPATPDPHLVSYFLLFDEAANKVLLVDHKKADLWLPTGGHVEPDEHPKDTVIREAKEELHIEADFLIDDPIFLTVTKTQGTVARHTDVSLWYILRGSSLQCYEYDPDEFSEIRWFLLNELPYSRTDPHLKRFIEKLKVRA